MRPALRLATHTFQALSSGWGLSTGAFAIGIGIHVLGSFLRMYIDPSKRTPTMLLSTAVVSTVPLLVALIPATASSQYDRFVEKLNDLRLANLGAHERVFPLLDSLLRVNDGQGVGFKSFGVVIDRRMLKKIALGTCKFSRFVVHMTCSFSPWC